MELLFASAFYLKVSVQFLAVSICFVLEYDTSCALFQLTHSINEFQMRMHLLGVFVLAL